MILESRQDVSAHQSQKQELGFLQLQSLSILSMHPDELRELLYEASETNPWIELETVDRCSVAPPSGEAETDAALRLPSREPDFRSEVRLQLCALKLPAATEKMALFFASRLDGHGFLPEETYPAALRYDPPLALAARAAFRELEPVGIGSLDYRECLLAQLEDRPENRLARQILEEYPEDFEKRNVSSLARRLGLPADRIEAALRLLSSLAPYPIADGSGTESVYIVPDVIVEKGEAGFTVSVVGPAARGLIPSGDYRSILSETEDRETRLYLRRQLSSVNSLRYYLEAREKTLLRCTEELIRVQRRYFLFGPGNMIPYTQKQLSAALKLDRSTVCRALKDKYLHCPWGTVPFSAFFCPKLRSAELSSEQLRFELRRLIAAEDAAHPLSDEALRRALSERGFELSKRTVTKYRNAMGIPTAKYRKRV